MATMNKKGVAYRYQVMCYFDRSAWTINRLSSDCLNDMLKIKDWNYSFRSTRKRLHLEKETSTFGLRSISYLSDKLWNDNMCNFSDTWEIKFSTLNACIDDPSVLLVDGGGFPYPWYFHHISLPNVSSIHFLAILFSEYKYLSFSNLARFNYS